MKNENTSSSPLSINGSDKGSFSDGDIGVEDQAVKKAVNHIERLPHEQQQLVMSKLEMYSGPIPHPDILKKYDEMDPGAAKQIIDNGVTESEHRRDLESKSLEYARRDRKRRDWMGLAVALAIILVGAFLIFLGHTITGTVLSGVSAIAMVGLFLDNDSKSSNSKSNEEHDDSDNSEP